MLDFFSLFFKEAKHLYTRFTLLECAFTGNRYCILPRIAYKRRSSNLSFLNRRNFKLQHSFQSFGRSTQVASTYYSREWRRGDNSQEELILVEIERSLVTGESD